MTVFQAFDEAGDDLYVGFVQEVIDEVGGLQIGFVAGGDDVGVAEAEFRSAGGQGAEGGGATLGDEGDGAGLEVRVGGVGTRPDAGHDVCDAKTVGAAYSEPGANCEPADFFLKTVAFFASALGEAGGDYHGSACACFGALLEYGEHLLVGDDDADEVRGFGKFGERGVAADVQDVLVAWVDGIDPDFVLCLKDGAEEAASVLGAGSCANYGYGCGF